MKPIIYLGCLVVLIGSLAWSARAEGDFDAERARVIEIYGRPDVDRATKERNVGFLADYLAKNANLIELAPSLRKRVDDAVKEYKEEKAKQPLVDGAPPQGGFLSAILIGVLIDVGVEVAGEIVKAVG